MFAPNWIKTLAVTSAVLAALALSYNAESRGFQSSMSNGRGQTVQSSSTAQTRFQRGQGLSNSSQHTLTGPNGNTTDVDHSGNTSYSQDSGVTHTGSTTATGPGGSAYNIVSQSQIQKTDSGLTSTTSVNK